MENKPTSNILQQHKENHKKEILVIAASVLIPLILVALVALGMWIAGKDDRQANQAAAAAALEEQANAQKLADQKAYRARVFASTTQQIVAKSFMVKDLLTGEELHSKNPELSLPLASVTKAMTAITAAELVPDLAGTRIAFSGSALATEGENGFVVGEEATLDHLIDYMLVESSNDAAEAIAQSQESFIAKMNDTARSIGLTAARFYNASGLDQNPVEAGGYGSARDIVKLFEYGIQKYPDLFEETRGSYVSITTSQGKKRGENTNLIVDELPSVIASKTGYTELAGGNLAVVYDNGLNHPIAIVVLGSTQDARFTDVLALAEATRLALQYNGN